MAQFPDLEIQVIRSTRRIRTVSGRIVDGKIVVRIPARLTAAQEAEAVADIVAKVRRRSTSVYTGDTELETRARALNRRLLEGRAAFSSVRWVGNQTRRWGSYSPDTGEIRITDRLREVPGYVLDAVLVHELTHTFIHSGHDASFREWADRAPHAERAKGYLEAYQRFGVSKK
ncbi:DUF45 domain-containing protein [Corynebacterium sp. CCM 9185]|uniref:M48 family metallopeptidase n=1 Tax=Corynebacterium marambiense TaxID=2765364 RepID=A0ABS0VZ53_9CORY|nr:YgjP-like metallopeptidase domain-containing protein [Corynebacterium marambiense]MBI9001624.1 M48 family metallopeptidase [Corynebacterium marambiense]MCK7662089.1 DUF45 domain-containing protein [Corynebacterium marambiense]MCX7541358.1 DUF45 domain-containing protein [Corynebacterium marambiense]